LPPFWCTTTSPPITWQATVSAVEAHVFGAVRVTDRVARDELVLRGGAHRGGILAHQRPRLVGDGIGVGGSAQREQHGNGQQLRSQGH
jgi:hypothetical protein